MYEYVRVTVELKTPIAHKLHMRELAQTVSGIGSSLEPTSEIKKEKKLTHHQKRQVRKCKPSSIHISH